ncbi:MAG: PIG-L family deacetylase [Microthrixaceae bacterium]
MSGLYTAVGAGLRLMTVHAHPDDEASKGAAMVAHYRAEGVEATLVCCTGGEQGSILNPAMDRPEVRANLAAVRAGELARSAAIIGFDHVDLLGYHDSGMPDSPRPDAEGESAATDRAESPAEETPDPTHFANAPLDEAVGRLVKLIRLRQPHVVVTYGDDQGFYPHPDHIRVHDVCVRAFDRAADPAWYPGAGDPWQPSKMYYSVWSLGRIRAVHEAILALGRKSPYDERWFERGDQDHRITTKVDVGAYLGVRDGALRAHATQIDPAEPFWFALTPRRRRRSTAGTTTSSPGRPSTSSSPRTTCSPGSARAASAGQTCCRTVLTVWPQRRCRRGPGRSHHVGCRR